MRQALTQTFTGQSPYQQAAANQKSNAMTYNPPSQNAGPTGGPGGSAAPGSAAIQPTGQTPGNFAPTGGMPGLAANSNQMQKMSMQTAGGKTGSLASALGNLSAGSYGSNAQ